MYETTKTAALTRHGEVLAESACRAHALNSRVGEFIGLRREIHSEPELAFEEHRTAALVADKLEARPRTGLSAARCS